MNNSLSDKVALYIQVSLAFFVWIFLILKAWHQPFIMDESTSFIFFAHAGDILPGMGKWTTNNHYLNSFFMWICWKLFGTGEFGMRIPNLIAFVVFVFYAIRIGEMLNKGYLRVMLLAALLGSLVMMEFFALARGYGLSFAAIFGAVYHQSRSFKYDNKRDEKLSFFWMVFAIFSNFNIQFYYLIYLVIEIMRKWPIKGINKLGFVFIRIVPIAVTIFVSFLLKGAGSLDLGQTSGLGFTFRSLYYYITLSTDQILTITTFALLFFILWGGVLNLLKIKDRPLSLLLIILVLVVGNIFMVWFNHEVLGVLYPVHRSAIHWYLLLIPAGFLALEYLPKVLAYVSTIAWVVFIGFLIHTFIVEFSIFRHPEMFWKQEQIDDRFYNEIKEDSQNNNTPKVIAGDFRSLRPWYYKQLKLGGGPSRIQMDLYKDTIADYIISDTTLTSEYSDHYLLLDTDDKNGLTLLKRKKNLNRKLIDSFTFDWPEREEKITHLLDSIALPVNRHFQISVELKLKTESSGSFNSSIEYYLRDKRGEKYNWKDLRLDYIHNNPNDEVISFEQIYRTIDEPTFLTLTLVNKKKKKFKIEQFTCYIYELF